MHLREVRESGVGERGEQRVRQVDSGDQGEVAGRGLAHLDAADAGRRGQALGGGGVLQHPQHVRSSLGQLAEPGGLVVGERGGDDDQPDVDQVGVRERVGGPAGDELDLPLRRVGKRALQVVPQPLHVVLRVVADVQHATVSCRGGTT
jgi:hypothetical protein